MRDSVAEDIVGTAEAIARNKVMPIVRALISENIVSREA
jgi:hypothetical protein